MFHPQTHWHCSILQRLKKDNIIMAKKLIMPAPGQVDYIDIPLDNPGPGQVLARTVISGISHGTEMTAYQGVSPFITKGMTAERTFRDKLPEDPDFYPFKYAGYDAVGIVKAIGEGVTKYHTGDRVWCEVTHQTEFLFHEDAPNAFKLPDTIHNDEALMLNLTSISYGAVLDAEIKLGDAVLIIGGGTVGQMAVQMANLSGARLVILVEPLAERRAFAESHTPVVTIDPKAVESLAKTVCEINGGAFPDVVIECTGVVAGLKGAVQCAGVAGVVVAAGFYAGGSPGFSFGEEFLHNRITIRASMTKWGCPSRFNRWDTNRILKETFHMMAARKLNLNNFVSARYPFLDAKTAYEAIQSNPSKYLKVALTY
jgi:2-desacetyl-2-hydroxyethyl bacteriochlorophyllide A dehydrogenase